MNRRPLANGNQGNLNPTAALRRYPCPKNISLTYA